MKPATHFLPLLTALVLSLPSIVAADELRVTADGEPKAVIVLAEPLRPDSIATKILISNLKQMSGATLPTVLEQQPGALKVEGGRVMAENKNVAETFIVLGEGDLSRRLGVTLEGMGAGGIVMKRTGNAIVLLSKDDGSDARHPASAHAVFNFLETLGCRSLWPGETGKVVPQKKTITVADLDVRFTPPVGQRVIRFAAYDGRGMPEGLASLGSSAAEYRTALQAAEKTEAEGEWGYWNGLGGNIGIVGGAAGGGLRGGWAQYGAQHPEWFALQADGTRDQSKAKDRWRLCVSNQGLIEHVADDIIAQLKEHPKCIVSLCPNDGGYSSFCQCDECRKLDAPDGPKVKMLIFDHVGESARQEVEVPALTDRYVHYWNAVVSRVTKVFPDQLFLAEAYSYYSDPPVHEKLHPNLVLRYVPNTADGWKGWQAAGATRVYWRPNNLYSGYRDGIFSARARDNAATQSYLAQHGMLATDMDSIFHHWATHGIHYYTAARLDWNPALTFDQILDDYCRTGFGAGAEEVKKYYLLGEKGIVPHVVDGKGQFPQIAPETISGMRSALTTAAKATENDAPSHRRVAFLRTGFEFTAASAEAQQLRQAAANGGTLDPAAVGAAMERRWQLMRAILKNQPLAVNVGAVAGNDAPLAAALGWKGPTEALKAGTFKLPIGDDWLNGDQSATRK